MPSRAVLVLRQGTDITLLETPREVTSDATIIERSPVTGDGKEIKDIVSIHHDG